MTIKDSAKTIVCYGDSNTWGSIPHKLGAHERYPRSVRWPSLLQNLLGADFEVVNEGLSARTFVVVDAGRPWRTGITHLTSILKTNEPVYLIIIMLGTNEAKARYNLKSADIANHLEKTIHLIHTEDSNIKIVVLCPPAPVAPKEGKGREDMKDAPELFKQLPGLYKEVADKAGCMFLNAGDYISSSSVDGYHLDPDAHKKLAEVLSEKIKEI